MEKKASKAKELTDKQKAEFSALSVVPDDRIDTSDIPEVHDWSGARRGVFCRPTARSGCDNQRDALGGG